MKNLTRLFGSMAVLVAMAAPAFGALASDPVYDKQCSKCHGKYGEGHPDRGPSLQTTTLSMEDIKNVILNGKGKMPGYNGRLMSSQVDALAGEIVDVSKNAQPH